MQTIKPKVKVLLCLFVALVSTVSQSQITVEPHIGRPIAPLGNTVVGTTPGQFAVSPTGAATYNIPIQVPPE